VDLQVTLAALLVLFDQDRFELVGDAGFLEGDVGGHRDRTG
jgi:hypothetical protein